MTVASMRPAVNGKQRAKALPDDLSDGDDELAFDHDDQELDLPALRAAAKREVQKPQVSGPVQSAADLKAQAKKEKKEKKARKAAEAAAAAAAKAAPQPATAAAGPTPPAPAGRRDAQEQRKERKEAQKRRRSSSRRSRSPPRRRSRSRSGSPKRRRRSPPRRRRRSTSSSRSRRRRRSGSRRRRRSRSRSRGRSVEMVRPKPAATTPGYDVRVRDECVLRSVYPSASSAAAAGLQQGGGYNVGYPSSSMPSGPLQPAESCALVTTAPRAVQAYAAMTPWERLARQAVAEQAAAEKEMKEMDTHSVVDVDRMRREHHLRMQAAKLREKEAQSREAALAYLRICGGDRLLSKYVGVQDDSRDRLELLSSFDGKKQGVLGGVGGTKKDTRDTSIKFAMVSAGVGKDIDVLVKAGRQLGGFGTFTPSPAATASEPAEA